MANWHPTDARLQDTAVAADDGERDSAADQGSGKGLLDRLKRVLDRGKNRSLEWLGAALDAAAKPAGSPQAGP